MEEFVKKLVVELKKRTGNKYIIRVNKIVKVNDVILHSINFVKDFMTLSPNIYVEGLYEKYLEGHSIEEIAGKVLIIVENQFDIVEDEKNIIEEIMNYENIRNNIVVKLINKKMNRKFLKGKVYRPFKDLAIIFYVLIRQDIEGMLSVAVTESMMEQWGVSFNDLFEKAMKNMYEKFPIQIESLSAVVEGVAEEIGIDLESEEDTDLSETDNVYVMTNKEKMDGATAILYDGALKEFASRFGVEEVIIVPSSCHEVLLIPKDGSEWVDENMFRETLRTINEVGVAPTDVLSNNVYIYNYETEKITIWDEE